MSEKRGLTSITPFGGPNGHPNYTSNQETYGSVVNGRYVDQTECCCYCGKHTKNPKLFAFLENVGLFMTKEQDNGMDDLGLYPVGSDCARILRKAGVKLYNASCEEVRS